MAHEPTVPQKAWVLPLRSIRIDVVEGPEAGQSASTDGETFSIGSAEGNDLRLSDPMVSRYHLELSPHDRGGALVVDHGSTNGTYVGAVRVERCVVPGGASLKVGQTVLKIADGETVALELHGGEVLGGLRGRTPVMRRLMAQVDKLARTDAAVLLIGESGTGKELVARALHDLGPRAGAPFVTVDCGSLSPQLAASELFGHERGAFTGAEGTHEGAFERASGGTVFLDEIGELPVHLQPTLLGVLERKWFRRVGGKANVPVDVRVVAATHRDLRAEVNDGTFRLDLYYRLAVALLRIPPLRERSEDIPMLVEHFAHECGHFEPLEAVFSAGALDALASHHWPGNVRELRNVVEAAVAMGEPPAIDSSVARAVEHVTAAMDPFDPVLELTYKEARAIIIEAFEMRYLERLLERAEGNVSRAAREARVDRSHLIDLLKRRDMKSS